MATKISTKYKRIRKKIDDAYAALTALQAECTHPNASKEYKGSTGNWCKQDDYYWIDYKCPECDKHWTTPQ
jgi:hypothetical protein